MPRNRRSIRLKGYDYSSDGAYFVTICTEYSKFDFGIIINSKMKFTRIGEIAKQYWQKIPEHFKNIKLDEFTVMPNHVHGIIVIGNHGRVNNVGVRGKNNVGVRNFEPLQQKNKYQQIIPKSLGSIIRAYKAAVTMWCNKNNANYFKWQRNYYERIIRNNQELNRIRNYIINNPKNWDLDTNNPKNFKN